MQIVLFGPPGVGKGTHARRLARDLGIPHISTGEMFREQAALGTDFGLRAAEDINRGQLVADPLVIAMLEERLSQSDAAEGYLLDGFPRTVPQARALAERLAEAGASVPLVISLDASEDVLVKRVAGRVTCSVCGSVFNVYYRAPRVAGTCDQCGAALRQRDDDSDGTVRRRLIEYRSKTQPVLDFFAGQHWPLVAISAVGEVEDVFDAIRAAALAGTSAGHSGFGT